MKKIRLDKFLVDNKFSDSKEKAKKEIISGWVKVNGETVRDPLRNIKGVEQIKIERPGGMFVSRGGEKLQKALDLFNIDVSDKNCVDLGASTGGFTDCMLKRGASTVVSVDVGYGQLDYSLRSDSRVDVRERTNARDLKSQSFSKTIDFVSTDLSFVSILKIFDVIQKTLKPIDGVFLLKPQFEANSDEHIKGVVRLEKNHNDIILRVLRELLKRGVSLKGITYSPIKGPAGNIEFLVYYVLGEDFRSDEIFDEIRIEIEIEKLVNKAHLELNS